MIKLYYEKRMVPYRHKLWMCEMKTRTTVSCLALLCLALFLYGCERQQTEKKIKASETVSESELSQPHARTGQDAYVFGFDLRSSPQEDAKQYTPLLKYLKEKTGYSFELRFTPKGNLIADDLGTGVVHFAAIGADTYIQARKKYGVIPMVRGLNPFGKAEYQSVIVVARDSPIKDISDIRGKRFAFGSRTSTQGHLIPRIILSENGIGLDDLASYEYTGSHQNCANSVASGKSDVCGMQDTMGKDLDKQGIVRIIHASEYYPSSGVVANQEVDPEVIEKVTQAMIDFEPRGRDAEVLYHWDRTEMPNGFKRARDEDYAKLRDWVKKLGYFPEGDK